MDSLVMTSSASIDRTAYILHALVEAVPWQQARIALLELAQFLASFNWPQSHVPRTFVQRVGAVAKRTFVVGGSFSLLAGNLFPSLFLGWKVAPAFQPGAGLQYGGGFLSGARAKQLWASSSSYSSLSPWKLYFGLCMVDVFP
jgi:hypothetical protein